MQVVQAAYRAKELVNITHIHMKDEKASVLLSLRPLTSKKRIKVLNTKLTEADREKKSVEVALQGAEKQAEAQHKQLHQAEDELAIAKK